MLYCSLTIHDILDSCAIVVYFPRKLRCLASLAVTASILQTFGLIRLERTLEQPMDTFPSGRLSCLAIVSGDPMPHAVAPTCEEVTACTMTRFTFYRFLPFLRAWNTDSLLFFLFC